MIWSMVFLPCILLKIKAILVILVLRHTGIGYHVSLWRWVEATTWDNNFKRNKVWKKVMKITKAEPRWLRWAVWSLGILLSLYSYLSFLLRIWIWKFLYLSLKYHVIKWYSSLNSYNFNQIFSYSGGDLGLLNASLCERSTLHLTKT